VSAPTGGEIDISLSLRTTRSGTSIAPALFIASKAMPADMAPSPITAMARRFSPFSFAAAAMPSAAEIEVLEWAVPKVSYFDSARRGKPEMPSSMRSFDIPSRRPVRILCA
jgi:hypothetical protein